LTEMQRRMNTEPEPEQFEEGGPDDRQRIGAQGEELACGELVRLGYTIVERNKEIAGGELDIIAEDGDVTAIVEVKTRIKGEVFRPSDALTWHKARQIKKLAKMYLSSKGLLYKTLVRFDLAEVILAPGTLEPLEIRISKRYFD